jgi:CubicO group peptidase (beta-lactamase class C family)
MRLTRRPVIVGALALGAGAANAQTSPFDGEWHGALDVNATTRLRLRLVVSGESATLYSIDQANAELRANALTIEGDNLSFRVDAVGGSFRGRLHDGRIVGEWMQGAALPLTFGREPIAPRSPVRGDGAANPAFDGEWHGLLDAGGRKLRLRLDISGESLRLASLDQGNAEMAADAVEIDGEAIYFRLDRIGASYLGALREGRIAGVFTQGAAMALVFQREPVAPSVVEALTQARLAALLAQSGAPALAAAAAKGRRPPLTLVAGVRQAGSPQPATTADRWHLGSITKSMTATLIARAVEAGALSWSDTVSSVLGSSIPDMRAEYRDATLPHLLSHRAGLQANIAVSDLLAYPRQSDDARADRIAYARQALAQAPAGPKEQTFVYSNSGYVIAGAMLEAKLGAPWESLMRARLFEPLRLRSAGFGAPGSPGALDQPVGHAAGPAGISLASFGPGAPVNDNPAVLGPAGRAHASLEDMLAYLAAHRDRSRLLQRASWDKLHTPPFGGDYAMGWVVRPDGLWHNGSNTLWYAEVLFDRGRGVVAAAASNDGRLATVTPAVSAALAGAARSVG